MTVKKAIRCLTGMLWYGFAGVTVLAAVLLTLARLLLPLAEEYRQEIEAGLSEYAGQPVRVSSLKAEWNGFEPQLRFSDVRLYDKQGEQVLFQFADAKMGIDIITSIKQRDFAPSSFIVSGIELSVTRHSNEKFSIAGLSASTDKSNNADQVIKWLLRQPDIGIESSTIIWTDIPLQENQLVFNNVSLRLRNDADTHQLTGHVRLPEKLGKQLDFALDMSGVVEEMANWSGNVYVKASDAVLTSWWRKSLWKGRSLASGTANLEAWASWQNQTIQSLQGKVHLVDLSFAGKSAEKISVKDMEASVHWRQNSDEWALHLAKFKLATRKYDWPTSEMSFRYDKTAMRLAVVADYVQLADVLPMVTAFDLVTPVQSRQLDVMQTQGVFHHVSLLVSSLDSSWHIDGHFSDVGFLPYEQIPGIKGLAGSFVANNNEGSLQIDTNSLVIETVELFRKPIALRKLTGGMTWQKDGSAWLIETENIDLLNDDLTVRMAMSIQIPETGAPGIDMLVDFRNANAARISHYLPVPLLLPETVAWLDKSIIAGTVPTGKLILRGPLDKFPYDNGEGKFEVRFDVVKGKLDYEPGWPLISDMQGEVVFRGRSLDINGKSGRIFNARVHDVKAHIDDIELDNPLLNLSGQVESSTSDLIKYVTAAKLAEAYRDELKQLKTSGKVHLNLDIKIPTSTGDGQVSGIAVLENATLGISKQDVQLEAINGKVLVSNSGLHGEDIDGRLFKLPVKLAVSQGDDAFTAFSLSVEANVDLNTLIREKFNKTIPIISKGKTQWIANLTFRDPDAKTHPLVLSLSSELKNVSVSLPEPFAKLSDAIVPIRFSTFIEDEKDFQIDVDYGDDISAIIALTNNDDGFTYAGSSFAFGDTLPIPPSTPRLSIVGQLDSLSLDAWLAYFSMKEFDSLREASETLSWLEEVDIKIDSLTAMGAHFSLKNFSLSREEQHWHSRINADSARGEIIIPYNVPETPVKVDLAYLNIVRQDGEDNDVRIDPRELPGVDISVDKFAFDGVDLGAMNAVISRHATGLKLEKLTIVSSETSLLATGVWQIEQDEQVTRLNAKLKAKQFSKLLESLGYSVGFEGGKTRNTAQLEWSGSPFDFSISNLQGQLQIKIDKGQLLDVSPGAGRIFGLISLQALPRRLTLDFSDLFKKGFSFDRIKGNFQLDQGDAYTTDLYLEGPAARLDVSGRTGLVAHDYDQLITVTPDLTGSLPIAGALVGGPIAGGVVFALDKLFRPAIDDITRYQYTVTGSWDDPQVVKLDEPREDETTTP